MSEPNSPDHLLRIKVLGLTGTIVFGGLFLLNLLLYPLLDSAVYEFIETLSEYDPFYLEASTKWFIGIAKLANSLLLITTAFFVLLSFGLFRRIEWARKFYLVGLALTIFAALAFPIFEWSLIDRLLSEDSISPYQFEGGILWFKLISAFLAIAFAIGGFRLIDYLGSSGVRTQFK